jgi:hypothetical protein
MVDASAMLWRLELRGVDVLERWQALAQCWEPFAEHAYYAFNDVHALVAFLGAHRFDLAQCTIAALERKAAGTASGDTNARMTREVGLPLARGLLCFASGKYDEALEWILPIRTIAHRFGGSHAQRDLVHLTIVEAALRARKPRLARALVAERTQLKPTSPFNWQLTARVFELTGDAVGAGKARENAETRRKAQFIATRAVA